MMIIMRSDATPEEVKDVVARVELNGLKVHISQGSERVVIGAIGDGRPVVKDQFALLAGVDRVVPISRPYKLASLEFQPAKSSFQVGPTAFGGDQITLIAGPCSVESREQILETACAFKEGGRDALRGGAFKPRTSPYSFQGMGLAGLELLAEAREQTGLPVVTEVMSPDQVCWCRSTRTCCKSARATCRTRTCCGRCGEISKPVLLKRGMMATMEELLMSAEYILSYGNSAVMLCERGIRTFETYTRNTFDINAIPALKALTHLPIMVDPATRTGHWEYVARGALAAVAAGADGLMIEVHPSPEEALSDGIQSLKPDRFAELVATCGPSPRPWAAR